MTGATALRDDKRAATIVEFAMILPALLTLVFATMELGYRVYLNALVQGALLEAARAAAVGNKTRDQIDAIVRTDVGRLTNPNNVKSIKEEAFYNYSYVGKPEKITTDIAPLGVYNPGDCYEDANNNLSYDATPDASNLGTADDIVRYTIRVEYPDILPVRRWLNWPATQTIVASTVLRNQPFSSRASPTIRCS